MKKNKTIIVSLLFIFSALISSAQQRLSDGTIHDYKVFDIDGNTFDFASLKGKKVLVVNTASECGFTPQYADLEKLYQKYKAKNFIIIGFPTNNFGGQEPEGNAVIKNFCQKNYGVTFPMMGKISVKGNDKAEIYKWLTEKEFNEKKNAEVKWNFQKFMVDENGKWVDVVDSKTSPLTQKITDWIEGK